MTTPDSSAPGPPRFPEAPPEVLGLDLKNALKGLNGKWLLLKRLLEGFRADFGDAPVEIRGLLEGGELGLAASKLHTLKGVAGMLGAPRLHEATLRLEQEIHGAGRFDQGWSEFQQAMDELLGGIAQVISPTPMPSTGEANHGQDPCR